jgi:hypothetical protein
MKEPKIITGTIHYTLKVDEEHTEIEYNTTLNNDLAVLSMAQYISEMCAVGQRELKKYSKGKEKQAISANLDRILKGRNALNIMIGLFLDGYDEAKKAEDSAGDHKDEAIKKWLADNNVTTESGVLDEEQIRKLIEKKKLEITKAIEVRDEMINKAINSSL